MVIHLCLQLRGIVDCYRCIDIYPYKCGVQPIIKGLVYEFKPWYFDGKTVWWGPYYSLRSDAEEAALKLKQQINSNDNNFRKTKNQI